jgi:hypothetical protein
MSKTEAITPTSPRVVLYFTEEERDKLVTIAKKEGSRSPSAVVKGWAKRHLAATPAKAK